MKLMNFIKKFNREESGQDLVEYAFVLLAVAGAVVAGSVNLSTALANAMTSLDAKITALMP